MEFDPVLFAIILGGMALVGVLYSLYLHYKHIKASRIPMTPPIPATPTVAVHPFVSDIHASMEVLQDKVDDIHTKLDEMKKPPEKTPNA